MNGEGTGGKGFGISFVQNYCVNEVWGILPWSSFLWRNLPKFGSTWNNFYIQTFWQDTNTKNMNLWTEGIPILGVLSGVGWARKLKGCRPLGLLKTVSGNLRNSGSEYLLSLYEKFWSEKAQPLEKISRTLMKLTLHMGRLLQGKSCTCFNITTC